MIFESKRDKDTYYSRKDNVCIAHFHKSTELIYVISGEKRVRIANRELLLREREMAIVPPCEMHAFFPSDTGEQIVLSVLPKYCEQFSKTCERATPVDYVYSDSAGELLPLLEEAAYNRSELFLFGVANLAFARFCAAVCFSPKPKKGGKSKIEDIYDYIEKNYAEDISLGHIASHFGYSKNHFSMLFKKNFNMGYTSYLNNTRVLKSLKYLKSHSIYEVSLMCGFKSPQQYHWNFKRVYGCSPRRYFE